LWTNSRNIKTNSYNLISPSTYLPGNSPMATDFYMKYVFYGDNIQFDSKIQTDIEANC